MRNMMYTSTYNKHSSLPDNDDNSMVEPTERAEKNEI